MAASRGYVYLFYYLLIFVAFRPTNCQFSGWEDYLSSWLSEEGSDRLFPFGEDYHDTALVAPTLGSPIQLNFVLPFYGRFYSSAFVNIDGHIELSNTDPATNTAKGSRTEWPNPLYPEEGDPPFLAPYMGEYGLSGLVGDMGHVLWRIVDPDSENEEAEREIAEGMLSHLSDVIHQFMLGVDHFEATHGLVVTWSDVIFQGCILPLASCPTNTVQAAIVTDGVHTFAVYNYYKLSWIGSLSQGYDPNDGITCTAGGCRPAQAGFNAGGAQSFHALPFSNTEDVRRLVDIGGRFVYGVGSYDIQRGGCTNQTDVDPIDWPLVVSPDHGTMLGGQVISLSGPCFMPSLITSLHCRFGDVITDAYVMEGDHFRAACVTPLSLHAGHIRLELSMNGGETWPYRGWFHYHVPDEHVAMVMLTEPAHWHSLSPDTLAFTWDPEAFDSDWTNDTVSQHLVDIRMYGYFETLNNNGTKSELRELITMAIGEENDGHFEFSVEEMACYDMDSELNCVWDLPLPVGLVEVRQGDGYTARIWSTPFPLGWYVSDNWAATIGSGWADEMCAQWTDVESGDWTWQASLTPCPPTAHHAMTDVGAFIHGADCNLTWPICPKTARTGHLSGCYDQLMPTSDNWPSVSHCCYDDQGDLLYAGDAADLEHASPSYRAAKGGHSLAAYGGVPMLSHYTWDIMYRTLCCLWSSDPSLCQDHYLKMRPTMDMSGYQPPGFSSTFGDPHVRTFDGVEYTFNGRGEYWLLQVHDLDNLDNINIQARMERPMNQSWGEIRATVMTVVAMQEGYADDMRVPVIEVALAKPPAPVDLLLMVDGEVYDVTSAQRRRLEIKYNEDTRTIMVINNDESEEESNRQANISIIFPSQIMVQAAYRDGALHVMTSLPDMYKTHTSGLLGMWNDDASDDLRNPSGDIISSDSDMETIHRQFGERWVISSVDSRFTYYGSMTSDSYHDPDFEPYFSEPPLPPDGSITEGEVDQTCGENFVCRFDYKTMMSRNLAITSMELQDWSREVVNISAPVAVCPYPDVPYSRREVTHYREGGTVTFLDCAEGYKLQGPDSYVCVAQGDGTANWDPELSTTCTPNAELNKANRKKIIKIVVPVVVVVVVLALAIAGFFIYRHRKKNKKADETARPHMRQNSTRSFNGRSSLDASTLERSFNPVMISRPPSEPELIAQGLEQNGTLAGSGALGSTESFPGSPQILDTRLRPMSPDNVSFGDSTFDQEFPPTPKSDGRGRSPSEVQATMENNVNVLMAGDTGYESSGFSPMIDSMSQSRVSVNYNPGYNNPGYTDLHQSRTSLHQSQSNLHQSWTQSQNQLNNLHQQNGLNHSLSQSRHSLAQSQHGLSNSRPSLHASRTNLSQSAALSGSQPSLGHVNLAHAQSVQSLSSQRYGRSQGSLGRQSQHQVPMTVPAVITDTTV